VSYPHCVEIEISYIIIDVYVIMYEVLVDMI